MTDTKTISLQGSTKYKWDDVDKRAKQKGFNDRSNYIQYLIERDIESKKHENFVNYMTTGVILLLCLASVTLLLLLLLR